MTSEVLLHISGAPQPQGRGRAVSTPMGPRIYDPKRSARWKDNVAWETRRALSRMGLFSPVWAESPVGVELVVIHPRAASEHRKRSPVRREWCTRNVGDIDNVSKAILDALNRLLWADDRQVAHLEVEQYIGAQDEAPGVWLRAWSLEEEATHAETI